MVHSAGRYGFPLRRTFSGSASPGGERRRSDACVTVGTLDDPAIFECPQMALFTFDTYAYHAPTEGIPAFERLPDGSEVGGILPFRGDPHPNRIAPFSSRSSSFL